MGNCLASPVNDLQCPSPTNSSVQARFGNNSKQHGGHSTKPENVIVAPGDESNDNKKKEVITSPPPPADKIITQNLKVFTFPELKNATRNFRPDTVLGRGGFGTVFKGWVDATTYAPSKVGVGMAVAVKMTNPDSQQGLEEWQSEVQFLGKFSHPNLVKLLGYCWEDTRFLLVYEYMQKGSLENHLFRQGADALPWHVRFKVAIGAARGLAFLHSSEKSVIYRDFKSSNILLDGDYNAKLSDFGLAKICPINGNSHVTTRIMGTYGYAAPEYIATGHLYVRSDVYGFGVVLLEILTGLRALDSIRPTLQQNLIEWARPSLSDRKNLKKIMDPRLEEQYPIEGAMQAAGLILQCLESDPKDRPSMEQVLDTLEKINAIKESSRASKDEEKKKTKKPRRALLANQKFHRSPIHSKHGGHRSPIHSKHRSVICLDIRAMFGSPGP